jgi:hypothetical protein
VIGQRLRTAVAGGTLLVLLATALAGCVRPASQGRPDKTLREATRNARERAEQARQEIEGALGADPLPEDYPAALERGRGEFQETIGSDGRSSVLGSAPSPDGAQFDLAIVGGAETGGGLFYAAAGVVLCARVTSTFGRNARAAIADLPCPPSLTSKGGKLYGLINQVVTLKG